jgi:hypothetical protein
LQRRLVQPRASGRSMLARRAAGGRALARRASSVRYRGVRTATRTVPSRPPNRPAGRRDRRAARDPRPGRQQQGVVVMTFDGRRGTEARLAGPPCSRSPAPAPAAPASRSAPPVVGERHRRDGPPAVVATSRFPDRCRWVRAARSRTKLTTD